MNLIVNIDDDEEVSSSQDSVSSLFDVQVDYGDVPFEYMEKIINYVDTYPKHKISTIQSHFKTVKFNCHTIARFREHLSKSGSRRQLVNRIKEHLKIKFDNSRQQFLIVHDFDLRRWAIQYSRSLGNSQFKASDSFIYNFKKEYNIVGRKITNIVTKIDLKNENDIQKIASNFVADVNEKISNYSLDNVINADHLGFTYEYVANRTLSFLGEKKTLAIVHSKHKISHSYTILPMITASGKILSPLFIILQETNGTFGPQVEKNLEIPKNIELSCSKSGKMSLLELKLWLKNSVSPNLTENSLLLLDSWSGFKNKTILDANLPKTCNVQIIPAKTTGMIQPCDVGLFLYWKQFVKKFYNRISLDNINIDTKSRNFILKMHSLIHNQFSAPNFEELIKYSWKKAGYDVQSERYESLISLCFSSLDNCSECDLPNFIKCSFCSKSICFEHFFDDNHFH